jgi:hypothetical protein
MGGGGWRVVAVGGGWDWLQGEVIGYDHESPCRGSSQVCRFAIDHKSKTLWLPEHLCNTDIELNIDNQTDGGCFFH